MKLLPPVTESTTHVTRIELPKQLENVPLATLFAMYFQHDGAPSHCTRHVMQHLHDTFHSMWIGRGSTINWPPRSPDLTPLDFYLWGEE